MLLHCGKVNANLTRGKTHNAKQNDAKRWKNLSYIRAEWNKVLGNL